MWHGTAVGVLVGVPQGRYCLTYVVDVSTLRDDEMGRACGTELRSEFWWGYLKAGTA